VPEVVAAMQELGARPSRVVAKVGPAICGRCYEVPAAMQEEVCAVLPEARSTTSTGTPGLDLPAAVVAQLTRAGVETVEVDPWCTAEREDLYSYRRDGVTGRFAGLVWLPA
jgi:polyphenol oxidase